MLACRPYPLIFLCFEKYRYLTPSFERPAWKTVIELIEADEVETLSDFSQPPDFAVRGL